MINFVVNKWSASTLQFNKLIDMNYANIYVFLFILFASMFNMCIFIFFSIVLILEKYALTPNTGMHVLDNTLPY